MRDTRLDRVGVVMDVYAGLVQLRPGGGGCEWDSMPEDLEPADANSRLRWRVAELNDSSLRGRA
jgi:hypothetical protein